MKRVKTFAAPIAVASVIAFGVANMSSAAPAADGKKVFDAACAMCHTTTAAAKMGPGLAKIGAKHDAAWLTDEIRTPKKHDPKGKMPAYGEKQIDAAKLKSLVAYLLTLK